MLTALACFGAATLLGLALMWIDRSSHSVPTALVWFPMLYLLPLLAGLMTGLLAKSRHALGSFFALAIIVSALAVSYIIQSPPPEPFKFAWCSLELAWVQVFLWVPFGWGAAGEYFFGDPSPYEALGEIDDSLPGDATVVVPMQLSARFSAHTRVLVHENLPLGTKMPMTHEIRRRVEERLFSISDLVAINRGDKWAEDTLAGLGRYRPGRTVGEFQIFVARSDAPRPADPDAAVQRILRWDQMSPLEWRWANDPG